MIDGSYESVRPALEWTFEKLTEYPPKRDSDLNCTFFQDRHEGHMCFEESALENRVVHQVSYHFDGTVSSPNQNALSVRAAKIMAIVRLVLEAARSENGFDFTEIKEANGKYGRLYFWEKIKHYDGCLDFLIGRPYTNYGMSLPETESHQYGSLVIARRSKGGPTFGKIVEGKHAHEKLIRVGYDNKGREQTKRVYPLDSGQPRSNCLGSW